LLFVLWAATGPIFRFSTGWLEADSTVTWIATFLMVLLIENAQNRDARAIHLKLNEVILAMDKAGNHLIGVEQLSDRELDNIQGTHPISQNRMIATLDTKHESARQSKSQTERFGTELPCAEALR
jgi:low affinity Fe/Cu permease